MDYRDQNSNRGSDHNRDRGRDQNRDRGRDQYKRRDGGQDQPHVEPLHSIKLRAGRRNYFFDVRPTKSEQDFYVVMTESKKMDDKITRSKIFLYKEDFIKFAEALNESTGIVLEKLKALGVEITPRKEEEHED